MCVSVCPQFIQFQIWGLHLVLVFIDSPVILLVDFIQDIRVKKIWNPILEVRVNLLLELADLKLLVGV